jgi:uncharacterized protein
MAVKRQGADQPLPHFRPPGSAITEFPASDCMRQPPDAILRQADHRPWPLPAGPWVMTQAWTDLLFAHWPLPPDALRPLVPPQLELDTWDGQAWIGVVPFAMRRVYPRRLFPVPWISSFLELNVRTYVAFGGRPGVYFFSLDAGNSVAVALARRWYRLPYFYAQMRLRRRGDTRIFESARSHSGAAPAGLQARYRPVGPVYQSQPGTLDAWLTERYCLYTLAGGGRVYRGEIHHGLWPLQAAEAEFAVNAMLDPLGLSLPDRALRPPVLHFSAWIDTVEWPIAPAG